tara:strand:+ start:598 stop:774 length:177 start_codon:yes stop_codon:yes gene_type:complete
MIMSNKIDSEIAATEEIVIKTKVNHEGLTTMVHDDGRKAIVHDSMISAYKSGGYKEEV